MDKTLKSKLNNIRDKILYNPLYIILIGFITFITWYFQKSAIGISVLLLISAVVILLTRDILPVMPNLLFCIYCVCSEDIMRSKRDWITMSVAVVILVIAIIAHMCIYHIKFKKLSLAVPLSLVSISLFLGGIGTISPKDYMHGMVYILTLGVLMLFLYTFISLYLAPPEHIDSRRYLCHTLTVLGILVLAQAAVAIIQVHPTSISDIMRQLLYVGWGNRNSIGITILICMSASFYLAFTDKKFAIVHYILPFIFYVLLVVMFARAALMAGTILLAVMIVYSYIKGKNRSALTYTICIFAILIATYVLLRSKEVLQIIDKGINLLLHGGSTNRDNIYREGIQLFFQHPIFGVGIGYVGNIYDMPTFGMYWFHNTLLQEMASLGVVGVIAYSIYYIQRGVIMFANTTPFNMLISFSILAFELNSLLEAGSFTPFPFIFIIIFITAFMEFNNKKTSNYLSPINIR